MRIIEVLLTLFMVVIIGFIVSLIFEVPVLFASSYAPLVSYYRQTSSMVYWPYIKYIVYGVLGIIGIIAFMYLLEYVRDLVSS